MRVVNIASKSVDLDRIRNPKLRKIALDRCRGFLFGYGDHEDHNAYSEYDDRDRGHEDYAND